MSSYLHDPNAVLDYMVDWSDWLGTDTIASVTWTVPTGITKTSQTNTTTTATAWMSGGSVGSDYALGCKVVTAGGRTDERTLVLQVRKR